MNFRLISHKGHPALAIVEALDIILGLKFANAAEATEYCRIRSDILKNRWNDSNQTDYGIYSDDDYIFEGLMSYYFVTRECTKGIGLWAKYFSIDTTNTSFFDLYNGIGLMTVFFTALGFKTVVHNDNPAQQYCCEILHDAFKLPRPRFVDDWRSEQFDWVGHFEVLEHFKNPVPVAADLAACIKSDGFMFESTGFTDGTLPGHFNEYDIDGAVVDGRTAFKLAQQTWSDQGLNKVYTGFSTKPRVWTRLPMTPIPKMKYIGAKNFEYSAEDKV